MNQIDMSLIDWSRAQFALTAIVHWLFVPLTLGLGLIVGIMESIYVKTGDKKWLKTTKFWMKIFGINFAIGVATGIILEFQFGTNWSNYSWFVGDIFGAPLAIEGVIAFFLEATFIAVMFFGWNKVSKQFHLTSTWLVIGGATLSALWILVANAWMQYPAGKTFNPDMVRNEMTSFWSVVMSPVAINKFFHTVTSSWVLGSAVVLGISSWFLLKKREKTFALDSIKVACIVGFVGVVLVWWTADGSARQVAQKQPMKLAAMEGLYDGGNSVELLAGGILTPGKQANDSKDPFIFKVPVPIPGFLSFLANRQFDSYVPGINNLINGGYDTPEGKALSMADKIQRGQLAVKALADYRQAKAAGDEIAKANAQKVLNDNFAYFGYGYLNSPTDAVPNVPLVFYSFHIMVILGGFFLILFILVWIYSNNSKIAKMKWLQWVCIISVPLAYLASQAGWMVAELGRQPWAIQDVLPLNVAISNINTAAVQLTFFVFLILFAVLVTAELMIMFKQIKVGPETENVKSEENLSNNQFNY